MAKNVDISMSFKVDWFAFTVEESKDQKKGKKFHILEELGYKIELFDEVAGKNFFNSGCSLGGGFVKIFYNDYSKPVQKGASQIYDYIFTGVGCTDLASKINGDWLTLFKWLKEYGVKFRRIDIALDDMNAKPKVDFKRIEYKLKRQEFRSSKRHYNVLRDVNTAGELVGETVYWGSRKTGSVGHSILRTYQKYLQMVKKHQESQMPIQALKSGSWIRWELEITKQKAIAMIDLILEKQSIAEAYYSVLRDTLEFIKPTKNKKGEIYKNKAKWEVCPWWSDFLNNAEKAKLQDPEKVFNIATALDWVRFSVVPTLQMLQDIYSNKLDVDFYDILRSLEPMEYSKKQKRVLLESDFMSEEDLRSYLVNFVKGPHKDADTNL